LGLGSNGCADTGYCQTLDLCEPERFRAWAVDTIGDSTYLSLMLEVQMEEAIANCPDLFLEPGLKLIRRQVVIEGRRPDVLFLDGLRRHLLVEIQRGRLDESHLQRHFYYYFDYRSKYPDTHPRLMFVANQMASRHKDFLDEHGYEFKEIPENEFERKLNQCLGKRERSAPEVELVTSPGVLNPFTYELLYEIEKQSMAYSYKMLLLMFMAELADRDGRVPSRDLAERFQEFFVRRALEKKQVENPNRPGDLAQRTVRQWETTICTMPVQKLGDSFVVDEGSTIRWASLIWAQWSPELKREIHDAAFDRLRRYFERHAGGL
jgi:Endonuclease NucS